MPKSTFEELEFARTPLGELILRRRTVASLGGADVFEVKLDGQFLMSSLVTDTEIALATLALGARDIGPRDVLVGGLGLGYTAKAALDSPGVRSVTVIEYLPQVIGWHRRELVPLAPALLHDPRCRLIQGDFFECFDQPLSPGGFASAGPAVAQASTALPPPPPPYHAILVDIDHSPQGLLQLSHAHFYTTTGLRRVHNALHRGGVFALWSAARPEDDFLRDVRSVFPHTQTHESKFLHPLLNEEDVNFIVVARRS